MSTISVEIRGLDNTLKVFDAISDARRDTLLQQSINRAGRDTRVQARRMVQELLPIRVSLLNSRVRWTPMTKKSPGVIRFLGWGKYDGSVKPRYMKLKYPYLRVTKAAHLTAGANRRRGRLNAVTYGVGVVGRRSVRNGFVVNVLKGHRPGNGRNFVPSYSGWFSERRATVFQRLGRKRLPIEKVTSGLTVGEVARRAGIPKRVEAMLQDRASSEFARRIDAELAQIAKRRPTP